MVSKSIDLGPKSKTERRKSKNVKIKELDPSSRSYLEVCMIEILQLMDRNTDNMKANLKRFGVLTIQTHGKEKIERSNVDVYSDSLKVARTVRVESQKSIIMRKRYNFNHKMQDTFIKRILIFMNQHGLVHLPEKELIKFNKYIEQTTFNPFLNVFIDYSKSKANPMSFLPLVYMTLNNDLKIFLEIFFMYNIKDFMSLQKNIKFGFLAKFNLYSGVFLRHINISDHLFLQRTILPFHTSAHRELRIAMCTWNLAGKDMTKHSHYLKQISRKLSRQNPDIIVYGFQEIVEMKMSWVNLKNIMFKCEEISLQIKQILDKYLSDSYICVSARNLMGMLQMVYVHYRRYPDLHSSKFVNWDEKFGGKGGFKMGNKGVVGCIFDLSHFGVFSFSNCHLTHGFDKVKKRVQKVLEIIECVKSMSYVRFGNF